MKLCYFILFFVFYRSNADYPTECAIEGLFCVMDGQHDYQYLECSADFKGFRDCAVGTKCAGEQDTPYTYNPCIIYSATSSSSQPTESSGKPVSSEQKPASSEQPITPSTGTESSAQSQQSEYICKEDGFFCVMNGEHDYEYLECSEGYKGFRPCALGTKCAGEKDTPYTYNPCVVFTSTQSEQQSSIPTEQSSTKPVSSEQKPVSSEQPITPSTGTDSSESSAQSQQIPIDCSVDGFFCVDDGQHDYQYLECSIDYKGYRPCAPGTKCAGANNNPYTYNPCIAYPYTPSEQQSSTESSTKPVSSEQKPASSEQPITPSTGTVSSESSAQSQQSESICKEDGFFCVDDGEHDYEYLECSEGYKGFRPCAVGTKCAGKKDTPYTYNPCVAYPYTPSEQPTESSTKPASSEEPITPSTGTVSSETSSESKQPVPTDCSVDGFFCVDDGQHDYQYLECSEGYKGFRPCAVGTKCAGESNNPYTYNPCVSYPYTPSEQQSSTESSTKPVSSEEKSESSEEPITPSTGTDSSEESSESKQPVPTDCSVDGFFCVDDGQHDFQYLECSEGYKGFRQCAPGTKCAGANNNPYTYNPCIAYPYTPSEQQSTESSSKQASSEEPITPSTGTVSSEESSESKQPVPTDCSVDGFFCVDDGQHDYQYLECSEGYKGFRQCAPGTKCAGANNNPYTYNPCIAYPYTPSEEQSSTESSSKPASSEEPITPSTGTDSSETSSESKQPVPTDCSVDGFFCVDDGQHDFQYLECSAGYKGFRPCAPGTKCAGESNNPYTYNPCIAYPYTPSEQQSEQSSTKPASSEEPITPSTGTDSSETSTSSESKQPVPTDCSVDGFFCVDDGQHDFQYLECSAGYKGFRPCAVGTKCAGANNNPYTYNPCVAYPYTPSEQQSSTESSTKPTSSEQKPASSEEPITPSIGGDSSETSSQSQQIVPTDCSVDGFFCVDDGQHDYQYLECSVDFKGFRPCAPGTKCAGANNNPYTYNPCISYPYTPSEQQSSTESSTKPTSSEQKPVSSEEPTTPSIGGDSSETSSQSQQIVPTDCSVDGFFCVDDGQHDYQYLECSADYKGFRPCAPGTKCAGQQNNPYTYNPCISYPYTPSEQSTESSSKPVSSEQKPASSEEPITPSTGTVSSESSTQSQQSESICKEDGYFCVMNGEHDYEYLECSEGYKGFRPCAPGTKCAGEQDEPYKFNPCVIYESTQSEHSDQSKQSEQQSSTPTTPSVGTSSEEQTSTQSQEEYQSCGDFECQEDGLYCQIDGQRNNRYCECAQTFKGSRPCAPGTWCQGKQDAPYEYNPCVFIDQTSWFGNVTKTLPQ